MRLRISSILWRFFREPPYRRDCRFLKFFVMAGVIILVSFAAVHAREQMDPIKEYDAFPFLTVPYSFPANLTLCGEPVPLNMPEVWEALDLEFTIAVYSRGQVMLWLKRSGRYFPEIEKKLEQNGMPDDIKYLAVAESDLRIHAFSNAGAGGPWQFIRPTAKKFGLRQGGYFDDRLHFEKATDAALRYLKQLYEEFGSWTLAMAAYNCGEKRVRKEIKGQGESSYYRLNLPRETERYIYRILAIKTIMSDPRRYGYFFPDEQRYGLKVVDELDVSFPNALHMRTAAKACGSYLKQIKELNPEIRGYYFPQGAYRIRLPAGTKNRFEKFYGDWVKENQKPKHTVHRVRKGDTLQRIANQYGVNVRSLRKWNGLKSTVIHPGQKLKIY